MWLLELVTLVSFPQQQRRRFFLFCRRQDQREVLCSGQSVTAQLDLKSPSRVFSCQAALSAQLAARLARRRCCCVSSTLLLHSTTRFFSTGWQGSWRPPHCCHHCHVCSPELEPTVAEAGVNGRVEHLVQQPLLSFISQLEPV